MNIKNLMNICIQCQQLAKVSCSCDTLLRFCVECYLLVHKNTQGNHDSINLDEINEDIQKIHSNKETKLESIKFSKNLTEINKQLQSNFDLFLEAHTSTVYSVAITANNTYIISGSDDTTIRV